MQSECSSAEGLAGEDLKVDSCFRRETNLPRFLLGLGLALSLFFWGMQYKLSLYDPPESISHSIPAAKLLSGSEKTVEADKGSVQKGKTPFPDQVTVLVAVSIWVFALITDNALEFWRKFSHKSRQIQASLCEAFSPSYYFRPPPVLR